jgi:predicted nucleotide-binding protein (sugar kinase/HSP70/actin superfamily)
VAGKRIGNNIFFQGGVAFNKSVVAAFEKHLGTTVTVPPNHDVTGAIGMALIAMRHTLAAGIHASAFKGFDRVERPYEISSFGCGGCSNMCEINRVKVAGERQPLFYGGRCEKYDISRKDTSHIPDLFKFRDELLWQAVRDHEKRRSERNGGGFRARIGIPYIFFFNEYLPFWVTLLDRLGFEVAVSPRPNRQIVDSGLESVLSEACFPVKVAIGHIRYLKEQAVDALLIPSFVNLNAGSDEYMNGVACPHTQSIPYVGKAAVPGVEILAPVVDMSYGRNALLRELARTLRRFGAGRGEIRGALARAEEAQAGFSEALRKKGEEVLANLTDKAVVVVGRSYNSFERGMNLRIPEKLATLGVLAIPMDMLPLETCRLGPDWPNMYWRSGQKALRAARFLAGHDKLYPLFIGNFSCGPDSFILKYFKEELRGKPFLHIEIDEHSADAGAITRCEAFLDSIGHGRGAVPAKRPRRREGPQKPLAGRTVYIPHMTDHALVLAAVFERCGVPAEVLPEPDRESVDVGMKFVSGKECYPCAVTTGDMVKKTRAPGFDPERSAFFMPSGSGPCRFGQYNVFHKSVLEDIGLDEVPVFAPNQDEGLYDALETVSEDFVLLAWKGIVAMELLLKCLHETRPYETAAGASDALYQKGLQRIRETLRRNGTKLETVLSGVREEFAAVPKRDEQRPLIGLVGEVYVRLNRFANEDVIKKVESLGGEVWLTPFEEWVFYLNAMSIRRNLRQGKYLAAAKEVLKRLLQGRVERRYAACFEGALRTLHEPSTRKVLQQAAPYIPDTFEGEAVLSIGKSVDLAKRSASGIINAIPFGCMPGTIVAGVMQAVKREHGMPFITIAYDGTESPANTLQLEAFMDQARARAGRGNGNGSGNTQ